MSLVIPELNIYQPMFLILIKTRSVEKRGEKGERIPMNKAFKIGELFI